MPDPVPAPEPIPVPVPAPAPVPAPTVHTCPAGVPTEYFNPQTGAVDYAKWGEETRTARSRLNDPKQTIPPPPQQPSLMDLPENATKVDITKKAGLDPQKVAEEYTKNGKLSEEMYQAYEKVGYPRAIVNAELAESSRATVLDRSVNTMMVNQVFGDGGVQKFQNIWAWAETGLPADKVKDLNTKFISPDVSVRLQGINELKAAHLEAVGAGKTNPLLEGDSGKGGIQPFANEKEFIAASRDARYGKDAAYTQEVLARAQVSQARGILRFGPPK